MINHTNGFTQKSAETLFWKLDSGERDIVLLHLRPF
jgi:hypothetical protein